MAEPTEHEFAALLRREAALEQRVRHLEQMFGGTIKKLESGGNSIEVSPQGIVITSGNSMTITVGAAMAMTVGAAAEMTVGGTYALSVGLNMSTSVGANATTTIGANDSVTIGGAYRTSVGNDLQVTAGRSMQLVTGDAARFQGKNVTIEGSDSFKVTAGNASLGLTKDGNIIEQGKDITIKGTGNVVIKGSKISQN
jgi:type VI secretion system secreted protein VgrG